MLEGETKYDAFAADIRNKLSPILCLINWAYEDKIPMETREKLQITSQKSVDYILELLREFKKEVDTDECSTG